MLGSGTERGGTLGVLNCDSCFATVTTFAVRSFQHQYGLHMTYHLLFQIISHFPAVYSILGTKGYHICGGLCSQMLFYRESRMQALCDSHLGLMSWISKQVVVVAVKEGPSLLSFR